MGYTTEFHGALVFTEALNRKAVDVMDSLLGEDLRELSDIDSGGMTWVDLEYDDEENALSWDGSEKTYDLPEKIDLVLCEMRKVQPTLNLEGEMFASGEKCGDIWFIEMRNGSATALEAAITKGDPR